MGAGKFVVTKKAMRPASRKPECFYCNVEVGGHHKDDCVFICRKAKVMFSVELDVDVPAFWDKGMVEFRYNDSGWCGSNLIQLLEAAEEDKGGCLCDIQTAELISLDCEIFLSNE